MSVWAKMLGTAKRIWTAEVARMDGARVERKGEVEKLVVVRRVVRMLIFGRRKCCVSRLGFCASANLWQSKTLLGMS